MVRTRFAPSPTGYLHIGGVRTALFCWLFARQRGGQFILRIDDTDQQRNVEESLNPILDGLRWLGIDWDEGPGVDGPYAPYYQSKRADQHKAAVEKLLEGGFAYYDYATTEEIQQEREQAKNDKRPFVYSRRWMAETQEQRKKFEAQGRSAVVRLKMPREGVLAIDDLVRGCVEFEWAQEQDHVIQRTDGSCLYHLASVVDDGEFEITHVIRAEEHLSNTPRQAFIARSLGYKLPKYAHLPYVAEPGSKTKLSKRKLKKYLKNRDFAELLDRGQTIADRVGIEIDPDTFNPVIVDFYREIGFLPEALVNYLAMLGWSLDDKTEHLTREQLIEHLSLDRVNNAPASFDPIKLMSFQERHMLELPVGKKLTMVIPFLQEANLIPSPASGDVEHEVQKVIESAGDRVKVAGDVLNFDDFFTPDDQLTYDEKTFEKRIRKADAVGLIIRFRELLEERESFEVGDLEALMQAFVEQEQIKIGQIIHAVRVAVTGKSVGVGLYETMSILGKQRCLDRIGLAIKRA